jgi:hypothetical protein
MTSLLKSIWAVFSSFFLYHLRVLHLVWRGGLSGEFASVMAITGLMRREEVKCLYERAQEASGQGVIVEIGSYRGLSTVALASGSMKGPRVPVFAIDPHEFIDQTSREEGGFRFDSQDISVFTQNILYTGVSELVRSIHLFSWEVNPGWNKRINLLWIDGNHEYEAVKRDFSEWTPFLLPGSCVILHDSIDPASGPYRVVQEALGRGDFTLLEKAGKNTVLQKWSRSSASASTGEEERK